MEHQIPNDRLLDHTQGRLTPNDMAEISQKLAEDPKLQQRYAELRRLRRLVRERYQPEAVSRPDGRDTAVGGMIAAYVEAIQSGVVLPTMHLPNADFGRPASGEFSLDAIPGSADDLGMPAGTAIAEIPVIGAAPRSIWARAKSFGMAAAATVLAALAVWSFVDDKPATIGGFSPDSVGVGIQEPTAPPIVDAFGNSNRPTPGTGTGIEPQPAPEAVTRPDPPTHPGDGAHPTPRHPIESPANPDEVVSPRDRVPFDPDPDAVIETNTPRIEQPRVEPGVGPQNPPTGNGNGEAVIENTPAPATNGRPRGVDVPATPFQSERELAAIARRHLSPTAFEALHGRQAEVEREYVVAAGTKRGDVDGNGIVDGRDAEHLLRHILTGDAETTFGALADTNRDGRVDIRDHVKLMADIDPNRDPAHGQD